LAADLLLRRWSGRPGASSAWRPGGRALTAALLAPVIAYLVLFFVYPILITFGTSIAAADGTGVTIGEYTTILSSPRDWGVIALTLELAIGTTLLSVLLAIPLALILRRRNRGHRAIRLLIMAPLMILALVSALGLLILWDRHGWLNLLFSRLASFSDGPLQIDYTIPGLLLFYTWLYSPFTILTTLSAVEGIDPNVEEAARVSGASPWRVFRSVTLPLAWPGIRAGSVLTFLLAFGAFSVPLIAGGNHRPLPVLIYTEAVVFQDFARGSALAMVMAVVALAAIAAYMRLSSTPRRGSAG
jgi:putative spermidine/putrescine transport system permease protein